MLWPEVPFEADPFYFNAPASLWHVVGTISFRLLFIASTSFGDQVRIERLGTLRYSTASCYYGYFGREGLG